VEVFLATWATAWFGGEFGGGGQVMSVGWLPELTICELGMEERQRGIELWASRPYPKE
jgi:hypothetical protein